MFHLNYILSQYDRMRIITIEEIITVPCKQRKVHETNPCTISIYTYTRERK